MNATRLAIIRTTCVLLMLLTPILASQATQFRQLSVEEMGHTSTEVVQGKVLTTHSFWSADHTKILTEIIVDSQVIHKGTAAGSVRIVQLGGTVDNVCVTVHGALGWTPGEEVLLFLESFRDGAFVVTGLSQGKFGILRDETTGDVFVSRAPLEGVELDGDPSGAEAIEKVPLTQFLDQALGTGAGR